MPLSRRRAAAGLFTLAAAGLSLSRATAGAFPDVSPVAEEAATTLDTGRDRYEHMLAPVTINGQGPFQFLMDTGANVSCVSRELADRLALAALPPTRVHTVVGVRERPGVLIERLQVGERSRRKVHATSLSLDKDLDGVLGVDWLEGQRLEMGFKARSLAITRSKQDFDKQGFVAVIPARRRFGQLTIVDADLNGRRINAMIDSGSQMTICNAALRELVSAANRRSGTSDAYRRVGMQTLVGEQFTGELIYLPFVRLGGLQLGNVPVVYSEMHVFELWDLKTQPALILGMDLLTQFDTVALDFGRSQVRFDLAQRPAAPTA